VRRLGGGGGGGRADTEVAGASTASWRRDSARKEG
jgi:hypothetical protein